MKNLILVALFVACIISSGASFASESSDYDAVSFIAGSALKANYDVDAGQRFHEEPVFQNFIGINFDFTDNVTVRGRAIKPNNWSLYLEYWRSDSTEDNGFNSFGREVDWSADATYSGFRYSISFGVAVFEINPNQFGLNTVFQSRVKTTFQVGSWTLLNNVKYSSTNSGYQFNGGAFLETGFNRSIQLPRGMSFSPNVLVTRDIDGAFGFDPTTTLRVRPTVSIPVKGVVTIDLGVQLMKNFGEGELREDTYVNPQFALTIPF